MRSRAVDPRPPSGPPSSNSLDGGHGGGPAIDGHDARAALDVSEVTKWYGATRAVDRVSLHVPGGRVHGLLGANGAGKSTLVETIGGVLHADEGRLEVDGRPFKPVDVRDAERSGVVTIHQTLHMPPAMPVYEYLHLGRPVPRRLGLLVDWHRMRRGAEEIAERVGLADQLDVPVGHLHPAHRRMLAIGRALNVHGARVLLLDEPTAELDRESVGSLMQLIKGAAAHDTAVIFVSHRLDEVFAVCDSCTVLRNGSVAFDGELEGTSQQELIDLIAVSRETVAEGPAPARQAEHGPQAESPREPVGSAPGAEADSAPAVSLQGVSTRTLRDVSLEVREGEVVGLAGLAGAGRSSTCRVIFGLEERLAGTVSVAGRQLRRPRIGSLIRQGVFFVPEERGHALFTTFTVQENTSLANIRNVTVSRTPVLDPRRERGVSQQVVSTWEVDPAQPEKRIAALSGGNQQKVAIGKWLASEARLLVLDEPAAGIDVGTKAVVFSLLRRLADGGCAILMTSSDPKDLVAVCDRVLVLREGHIASVLVGEEQCTEETIVRASMGEVVRAA